MDLLRLETHEREGTCGAYCGLASFRMRYARITAHKTLYIPSLVFGCSWWLGSLPFHHTTICTHTYISRRESLIDWVLWSPPPPTQPSLPSHPTVPSDDLTAHRERERERNSRQSKAWSITSSIKSRRRRFFFFFYISASAHLMVWAATIDLSYRLFIFLSPSVPIGPPFPPDRLSERWKRDESRAMVQQDMEGRGPSLSSSCYDNNSHEAEGGMGGSQKRPATPET